MANDKNKPQRRPYVKKKKVKQESDETPVRRTRKNTEQKKSKVSTNSSRQTRYVDAQSFQPDKLTQRAVSKKMSTADSTRGFIADHARAIIVFVALATSLFIMYPAVREYYASKRNLEIYTAVAEYLTTTNEELEAKIQTLNSEEGIKQLARERGLVEPGEIAITVVEPQNPEAEDNENKQSPSNTDQESQENPGSTSGPTPKPNSKGVQEKEKIKKVAESIRDEGSTMQKFLDFIFGYKAPNIKVL